MCIIIYKIVLTLFFLCRFEIKERESVATTFIGQLNQVGITGFDQYGYPRQRPDKNLESKWKFEAHNNRLIKNLSFQQWITLFVSDLCENLFFLDQVVETVVNYNKNLVTWSSWKTLSLTADGVKLFKECRDLKELDLGWCLINKDPGDCLEHVANGCKQLKRYKIFRIR